MGNRALIATKNHDLEIYVHWNGGYESVRAFTEYCKLKGYRSPVNDCYGWARLCQVIGNFFGGDLSVGINRFIEKYSCIDNGRYYIDEKWDITHERAGESIENESISEEELKDRLIGIDKSMPAEEQLGEELICSEVAKLYPGAAGEPQEEQEEPQEEQSGNTEQVSMWEV